MPDQEAGVSSNSVDASPTSTNAFNSPRRASTGAFMILLSASVVTSFQSFQDPQRGKRFSVQAVGMLEQIVTQQKAEKALDLLHVCLNSTNSSLISVTVIQ